MLVFFLLGPKIRQKRLYCALNWPVATACPAHTLLTEVTGAVMLHYVVCFQLIVTRRAHLGH